MRLGVALLPGSGGSARRTGLRDGWPSVGKSRPAADALFDVVFDCAIDPAKGKGHEDFSLTAVADQTVLGGADADPIDDACPRTVSPPIKDPYPNGKLKEKGCGSPQTGGALGGPVLVNVTRIVQ